MAAEIEILLISDIPENAVRIRSDLEKEGISVITAGTLAGGILELSSENHFQMILLDFQFSAQDPFDIIEKLKKNSEFNLIPLIGLVHRSQVAEQLMAFELGVEDFILMPYSAIEMQLRIRSFNRMIRLQTEVKEKNAQLENLKNVQRMTVTLNHYINNALTPLYFAVQIMDGKCNEETERLKQVASDTVNFVSKVLRSLNQIVQSGKVRVQQKGVYRDIMYDIESELNELLDKNREKRQRP